MMAPGVDHELGGQDVQVARLVRPRTVLYVPALQARHTDDTVAPIPVPYVPAWQEMQLDTLRFILYVPAGQRMHALLSVFVE